MNENDLVDVQCDAIVDALGKFAQPYARCRARVSWAVKKSD